MSPNFHLSAKIIKDDSFNTNPGTLKDVLKNYVTVIATITGNLANKGLWLGDQTHTANT